MADSCTEHHARPTSDGEKEGEGETDMDKPCTAHLAGERERGRGGGD